LSLGRGGALALAESLPICVHLEALLIDRSLQLYEKIKIATITD
jgi:hypothetical protein